MRALSPPSDLVQRLLPSPPPPEIDDCGGDGGHGDEDDADDEEDDDDEADLLAEQVEVTEGGPDTSAGAPPSKFCLQYDKRW